MNIKEIPQQVKNVLGTLTDADFDAYTVGGCVRDLLIGKEPKDWDLTTNATPEQIQELFPDSFYENDFGTVGVKVDPFLRIGKEGREHDVIEVTTYRIESTYSDRRRPDDVQFAKTLEEDLSRRDFTMNAIAVEVRSRKHAQSHSWVENIIVDPFNGQEDITDKLIRAVGNADERFNEDALRMIRAVRLGAELDFTIETKTLAAIKKNAALLTHVSIERVRDEFSRIIMSPYPKHGIELLHDTGLLQYIVPELEDGIGVEQNHHHTYTVWEHNLRALETCPSTKLSVRLATLLHDVGKPRAKHGKGRDCTFYNHEYVGEHMTHKILTRLRYPKKVIDHASLLVRNHMFYYSVDEVSETAVRRIIRKVGLENMKDLMDVRIGDRLGSDTKKAKPYKLRHFEYMVEKVSKDPVSVKMLKLNGDIMIKDLHFQPGAQIGAILNVLLAEVIDDPKRNTLEHLSKRANELRDEELGKLKKLAKERIEEKRAEDDQNTKEKHWVK